MRSDPTVQGRLWKFSSGYNSPRISLPYLIFLGWAWTGILAGPDDPPAESETRVEFQDEFVRSLANFGADLEEDFLDEWDVQQNQISRRTRLIFDIDNWQNRLEAQLLGLLFDEARGDPCHPTRIDDIELLLGTPERTADELDQIVAEFASRSQQIGFNTVVDRWTSNDPNLAVPALELLDKEGVRNVTLRAFHTEIAEPVIIRRKLLIDHMNAVDQALLDTQAEISDFFDDLSASVLGMKLSQLDTRLSEQIRDTNGRIDLLRQEVQLNREAIIGLVNEANDVRRQEEDAATGAGFRGGLFKTAISTGAGLVPGVGSVLPGAIDMGYAIAGAAQFDRRGGISSLDPGIADGQINLLAVQSGAPDSVSGLKSEILAQIEIHRVYLREARKYALRSPSVLRRWKPVNPEDPEAVTAAATRSVRRAYWSLIASLMLTLETAPPDETNDFLWVYGRVGPESLIPSTANSITAGFAGDGRIMIRRSETDNWWFHRNVFATQPYFDGNTFYGLDANGDLMKLSVVLQSEPLPLLWLEPSWPSAPVNPLGLAFADTVAVVDSWVFGVDSNGHLIAYFVPDGVYSDFTETYGGKTFAGPITAVKDPFGDEITIVGFTNDGELGQFNTMEDGTWMWFDLSENLGPAPFQGFAGSITAARPGWNGQYVFGGRIVFKNHRVIAIMGRSIGGGLILLQSTGNRESPNRWRWVPLGGFAHRVDDPAEPFHVELQHSEFFASPQQEVKFHGRARDPDGQPCLGTQSLAYSLSFQGHEVVPLESPQVLDCSKPLKPFSLRVRHGPWLEEIGIGNEWLLNLLDLMTIEDIYRLLAHEDGDFGEWIDASVWKAVRSLPIPVPPFEVLVPDGAHVSLLPPPPAPSGEFLYSFNSPDFRFTESAAGGWARYDGDQITARYTRHFVPGSEYIYLVGDDEYLRIPIEGGEVGRKPLAQAAAGWEVLASVTNYLGAQRYTFRHFNPPNAQVELFRVSKDVSSGHEDWRQRIGSQWYDLGFLEDVQTCQPGDFPVNVLENSTLSEIYYLEGGALSIDEDGDPSPDCGVRWDRDVPEADGGCGREVIPRDDFGFQVTDLRVRGTGVEIAPGDAVQLSGEFTGWRPLDDPRRVRIAFALEDQLLTSCLFRTVSTWPGTLLTLNAFASFSAPTIPGEHLIYAIYAPLDEAECFDDAEIIELRTVIGSFVVKGKVPVDSGANWAVTRSEISGPNGSTIVAPGEIVTVDVNFWIQNPPCCPTSRTVFILGYKDTAIECIGDAVFSTTGEQLARQVTFAAPAESGEYQVHVTYDFGLTGEFDHLFCSSFKFLFSEERAIELGGTIGAFTVRGDSPIFLRGDCNNDGRVDISDAICTLGWLFLGGEAPGCIAVTNANGDAGADISDATYLLNHLFLGGPAPVAPYPVCGVGTLPADEQLGCETPPKNCPQ